jgi:hypothetical protein
MQPFTISHEHPDGFKPLLTELEKIPYQTANPVKHHFADAVIENKYLLA